MTKKEIIAMSDREFRDWLLKLSVEKRFDDMKVVSKIRKQGGRSVKEGNSSTHDETRNTRPDELPLPKQETEE